MLKSSTITKNRDLRIYVCRIPDEAHSFCVQEEEPILKKAKRIARKIVSLVLVLMVMMSVSLTGVMPANAADSEISQVGATATEMRTIYFSPNGYWNGLYAAYAWTDGAYDNGSWAALTKLDNADGIYSVEIPLECTNVIFCSRTIPGFAWEVVEKQTDALKITDVPVS